MAAKDRKAPTDLFADIDRSQSTLDISMQIQKVAQRYRFDWESPEGVIAKLYEELDEILEASATPAAPAAHATTSDDRQQRVQEELGDLLFTAISLARHWAIDPEVALREANAKFECRFQKMGAILAEQGLDITSASKAQLEAAWQAVKQQEQTAAKKEMR